jgi:hypothetical protein
MKTLRFLFPLLVLGLAALACNLPGAAAPTSQIAPLDQTVTALFKTAAALPSTNTPPPLPPSATPGLATATQAPPTQPPPVQPSATQMPPPTATNTSRPPAPPAPPTNTSVPSRPGAHAEAAFMNPAPIIDGDWSEWKTVAREYPATNVVFGNGSWTGENDLAGSYYVGWDQTYFYLAAKVRDDKYVQVATGENIFKGDSLELILDTNLLGDFFTTTLSPDDFQIGISPGRPSIGDDNPAAYLWFPSGKAGSLTNVVMGVLDEGSQYRVEAAIPWSVYGITPAKGMRMGFAFSVSDDDASGEAVQQSMVSSAAGRNLANPTTWGEVILK